MAGKNESNVGPRDRKDEERMASMAYEGGTSGAHMETQEPFEAARSKGKLRKRRVIPWMWGAAAASAAVGGVAFARTLVARRLAAGGATEIEIETEEVETAGRRGNARARRGSARRGARASSARKGTKAGRRTSASTTRAEAGTGSPKRRRGGENKNVRKAGQR